MRKPARANPGKRPVSVTASVPAPVKGWNARDALADMDPLEAVTLDNFFPTPSTVELRGGYSSHATGLPGEVETLMEYADPAGSRKLIAASENAFYNVTASGAVGAAMESGHTSSRWQHVNFGTSGGHFLVCVNGLDAPRNYSGSAWASAPAITGSGLTATNLVNVMAHQRRLFFCEKATLKFWFLDTVAAIGGTASSFDLAPLCSKGGELLAAGTWSVDSGEGMDDLAVFVTSSGQAVVYAGTDPSSASTWGLQGVYDIGKPIGRRCLTKLGTDLVVITEDGFVSLSKALFGGRTGKALSDKITNAVNDAARSHSAKFGWQATLYPRGKMLVFNIPITELGTSHQYVMNVTTGAWARFKNQDGFCWSLLNENLYFGGNTIVYKADDGTDDNGANVDGTVKPAFNYFGRPGAQKRFTQCRPVFIAGGGLTPAVSINVDFEDLAVVGSPATSGTNGAEWDVAAWDTSDWGVENAITKNWIGVGGIGYAGTLKLNAASSEFGLSLAAIDYMFEIGGPM